MNSSVSMNLSVIFHLKGINFTLSGACASGSHAIGLGFLMIRTWISERHYLWRFTRVNLFVFGSFDALGAFSKEESVPEKSSKTL